MEAHGGYLCRLEEIDAARVVALARDAVLLEGLDPTACHLQVSAIPRRKVVRFAIDGAHAYGREGARWYDKHHALASVLSNALGLTVHSYVVDEEYEQVMSYGAGRWVGGDKLFYDEVDFEGVDLDETAYERLKARWPLGHLAYVFGVARAELLRLPRAPSALLPLDGRASADDLTALLTPRVRVA